jgi:hypothetical protein
MLSWFLRPWYRRLQQDRECPTHVHCMVFVRKPNDAQYRCVGSAFTKTATRMLKAKWQLTPQMATSDSLLVSNGCNASFSLGSAGRTWARNYVGSGGNWFFSARAFQGVIEQISYTLWKNRVLGFLVDPGFETFVLGASCALLEMLSLSSHSFE